MGKDKLRRFAENLTFKNFIQPEFDEIFHRDHPLKGNWRKDFFHNDNPIVLELGCGRGEYTVALAAKFPDRNFIGIDIKGARMWRGAKTATENEMRKTRVKKRLTGPLFLGYYSQFLKEGAPVNLKTDSQHLHLYTRAVAEHNNLPIEVCDNDIYGHGIADEVLSIKTAYETRFLGEGLPITYLRFSLGGRKTFEAPEFAPDEELS